MQRRNPITLFIIASLCVVSIVVSIMGNKNLKEIAKENSQLQSKLTTLQQEKDKLNNDQEQLINKSNELKKKINDLESRIKRSNN